MADSGKRKVVKREGIAERAQGENRGKGCYMPQAVGSRREDGGFVRS